MKNPNNPNHPNLPNYTPVIGLEVHVELKTESKMFCGCSTDYFGKEPNTHTCPVCLGLPGALPVPNKTAIEWCIKIALALGCSINEFSKFDRKNYFYPDLAKGYQISQYDLPFGSNGFIDLTSQPSPERRGQPARNAVAEATAGGGEVEEANVMTKKQIRIRRVHMEEDTGKLMHQTINGESVSLIDFNRSGVPLVEIVTEPDFKSATEVKEYLQNLQQIVRYLDVSNADMEKGDMRLEPNISLKPTSHEPSPGRRGQGEVDDLPPYKVEVKNINSFRFVEKAINFEIKRQAEILDSGQTPTQETRGWNENKSTTFSQRIKEEANDYRYFPDPDIPPILFTDEQIKILKDSLPELQKEKAGRFVREFGITKYDAEILTRDKATSNYFEEAIKLGKEKNLPAGRQGIAPKQIANTIINKKTNITEISPEKLISSILASSQVAQIDEEELEKIIEQVLTENPKAVEDFKKGKESVIMFLIGQVMRQFSHKVDAQIIRKKLKEAIDGK